MGLPQKAATASVSFFVVIGPRPVKPCLYRSVRQVESTKGSAALINARSYQRSKIIERGCLYHHRHPRTQRNQLSHRLFCGYTKLVERSSQFLCNLLRSTNFDIGTLHQIYELSISEYSNRRRRRWITRKIASCFVCCIDICTGEDCTDPIGLCLMLQGHSDSRPRLSGSTSAHRINDYHQCALSVGNGLFN